MSDRNDLKQRLRAKVARLSKELTKAKSNLRKAKKVTND